MPYPAPIQTCSGNPWVNTGGDTAENENESEHGPYALKEAMAKSVNTYFVQLIGQIGLCPVTKAIAKMGVVQGRRQEAPRGRRRRSHWAPRASHR